MLHGAGGPASGITAQATLTVHYDATANSYTLTYPFSGSFSNRTQTFVPGDIQASADPNITVYSHTSTTPIGTPETDTLFLTKNSAGTLTYVGAGLSVRAYEGTLANQSVATTAFSYGINTTDAALPRTGTATFSVSLLGAYVHDDIGSCASPCTVGQWFDGTLTGTGIVGVNFGSGSIAMSGTANEIDRVTGAAGPSVAFGGTATLAATTNNFNGAFIYGGGSNIFNGNWLGRFYGPTAEEIGATFYATHTTTPGGNETVIGAIVGKRGPISAGTTFSYEGLTGWSVGSGLSPDVLNAIAPSHGTAISAGAVPVRDPVPAEIRDAVRATRATRDGQR